MRVGHRGSRASNGRGFNGYEGFTLIELMIALLIGVFLLGALLTIVQTNRAVFGDQNKMAQLQDAERMAMIMMSDVIQSAGYFPDPYTPQYNTLTGTLVAAAPFAAAGQSIYGTYSSTAPGDQLSVRYMTASGDNILNCSGQPNTSGANTLYVNTFQVLAGQLVCNMNGTQYDLVGDGTTIVVTNLSVLYGVATAGTSNSVDTYMNASQVNANPVLWNSVISVMIQLTFLNPLYVAGQGQPQTIVLQRVVSVMNQSGPME
jgi:type IV pilus assembly protein PilW